MADYEDRMSRFNAGVALTERIDSLQRAINMARFNPLAINPDTGTFNYEIMVSSNEALINEAWAKLNETEQAFAKRLRIAVRNFLKLNPLMTNTQNGVRINQKNYEKFMELIDFYEKINKVFLDSHNLNAPDSDDDEGL